jgi:PQQ-like domain
MRTPEPCGAAIHREGTKDKIILMTRTVFAALLVCYTGAAQNLPMFRGGLEHSGVYQGTAPRQSPAVKWQFQTGGYVISSPAVTGGMVYVGSMDQHLYALDRETGKAKWKFQTGSSVA